MKRLATILCGLWAVMAVWAGDAHAEKRVALVIGNSAYQNAAKLSNPGNDATAMAEMFRAAGFDVVEAKLDLGNLEFKRVAREFTAIAREADIAVMYFAGHGIEVNGTNYLLPVDAKLASDFDVEDEALSLDRLVRALEPAKRLRLVILDACRDNPFVRNMQRSVSSRSLATGLARVEPASSDTLIAFAAKAGSTADDGRGENSPFTAALLKHLAVPGRDLRIAFGHVRDEVVKTTGNKQEPFLYGSLGGATVALVPELKRVITVLPAPPAQGSSGIDPRRDYEFAERVGTKEAWDSFLAVHDSGFYASLARAQRDKLGLPDSARSQVPPTPSAKDAIKAPVQNIAILPPADAEKASGTESKPDLRVVTRQLQTELKRVGCDPGRVDGNWTPRSSQALDQFNRRTGTGLDIQVASIDALDTVKSQRARICPLVCDDGERVQGDRCVAIPVEPRQKPRKEAARPPEPSTRDRARERARERAHENRQVSRPAAPRRAHCAEGSPTNVGGRMCCSIDPERGAPRIVCP